MVMISVSTATARPTDSVDEALRSDVDLGVLLIEQVPPFAVSLQGIEPSGVLLERDWFEMLGPDTPGDLAAFGNVVQMESRRDWAYPQLPGESVRGDSLRSTVDFESEVSISLSPFVDLPGPQPVFGCLVDPADEALLDREPSSSQLRSGGVGGPELLVVPVAKRTSFDGGRFGAFRIAAHDGVGHTEHPNTSGVLLWR